MLLNIKILAILSLSLFGCTEKIVEGCTNSKYGNYNPEANKDDGSCSYRIDFKSLFKTAKELRNIQLKEIAFEHLRLYTNACKIKVSNDSFPELGDTQSVCLDEGIPYSCSFDLRGMHISFNYDNNIKTCAQRATLHSEYNVIGGDHIYIPSGSVPKNSKAQRHGIKTKITWKDLYGDIQQLDFYVEQLVLPEESRNQLRWELK